MRAKKFVACALSAAMILGLASMTGCGSAKKDYETEAGVKVNLRFNSREHAARR